MPRRNNHYNLENGFIHNWLAGGPQKIPLELERFLGEDTRQLIIQHYHKVESGIKQTPVERGPMTEGQFQVGDYAGSWNYYSCREDHLVDHSGADAPVYLRSWAFTQLSSNASQEVLLVLSSYGPADVWVNEKHIQRQEHFFDQQPGRLPFKILLVKGINKILVRFETPIIQPCPHAVALRVCKLDERQPAHLLEPISKKDGVHVIIPTLIQALSRRNQVERVAAVTYIDQDVFEGQDQIRLRWPEDLKESSSATIRLQTPGGQIYAEATVNGTAADQVFLGFPFALPEGPYRIVIMPLAWEYYDHHLRFTREIGLWSLGKQVFSPVPYGTFPERRLEALSVSAGRKGLFAEIAKMALDRWDEVDIQLILQTAQHPSLVEVLGMLGMVYRFGEQPQFPTELRQPLEDSLLQYPYGQETALPAGRAGSESGQILSYASEILAGQRFHERTFQCSGQTGTWHRQNGERLALAWLRQSGEVGFSDWDSSSSFAEDLIALSHLVDLAETEAVWEMAAVVMDKLFVTIAINSFQGVSGSTHGRINASIVKGGFLEPTSGITRLMWGVGIFNHHIAGTVSLACTENYELPPIISDIAVSRPDEMWSRERHAVNSEQVVNKVTYKSPDAMLCSAQDYRPGQKGSQEHIWQATLGPAAAVFVSHPACSSEEDAHAPNFWAGNASLPRVAQWKEVLIAAYHLLEDDWMGFTHAYFPTYAFNEFVLRQGWAFARKDDGYLALTAAQGLSLTRHGHYAMRELRSYGQDNIWLCHLGRAALDGDFQAFQQKILALDLKFDEASVSCASLRGEKLSFGWQGPFLRDGQEQPLSGFEHYEGPFAGSGFPSRQMEIRYGEAALRLDFGSGAENDSQ